MMPNLGGLDPRRISSMMKQMGISNKELPAKKVTIETESGVIVIESPSVTEITMQGQRSFQITGDIKEEETLVIPDEDIEMVISATSVTKEKAKQLLEESSGDIAQAISNAEKTE